MSASTGDSAGNAPICVDDDLGWRVHTPNLLSEVLKNPGAGILSVPLKIFGDLLFEVGDRGTSRLSSWA